MSEAAERGLASSSLRAQRAAVLLSGFTGILLWPSGPYYVRLLGTLAAAALWGWLWASGMLRPTRPRTAMWTLAVQFAVPVIGLSSILSRFPVTALTTGGATGMGFPYWVALLTIMLAASRTVLSRQLRSAVAALYIWVLPVAVVGLGQRVTGAPVSAGFINSNHFAPMMLIFMPVALGLAVTAASANERKLWRVAAAVLFAAAAFAGSAAGVLGLVAESIIILLFAPGLVDLRGRGVRRVLAFVLAAVLLLAPLLGLANAANLLPDRVVTFVDDEVFGTTWTTRVYLWGIAGREIAAHWLLGVGPDGFQFESQYYDSPRLHVLEWTENPDDVLPMDPHSIVALIPVNFGVAGAMLCLLLAIAWARLFLDQRGFSERSALLRRSFGIGACGFAWAALFLPLSTLLGGVPVLFAGLAVMGPVKETEPVWGLAPRVALRRGLVLPAAVAALLLGGMAVHGWDDFAAGMRRAASAEEAMRVADRVGRLEPTVAYFRYQELWLAGKRFESGAIGLDDYHAQVDSAHEDVVGYAPYLTELVRLSLDQAEATGRSDVGWERRRLADVLELDKVYPEALVESVRLELIAGDADAARAAFEKAEPFVDRCKHLKRYQAWLQTGEIRSADSSSPR